MIFTIAAKRFSRRLLVGFNGRGQGERGEMSAATIDTVERVGPRAAEGSRREMDGEDSRQRDCHFAGTPSPFLLRRLQSERVVQQNDSIVDG